MTREEAIDRLMWLKDVPHINDDKWIEAIDMAIEALSADAVQGWTPCEERLPEPPSFCLVTTDGSHNDVIDIALYMSDGWHKASRILAWMLLPTPYKESEVEE